MFLRSEGEREHIGYASNLTGEYDKAAHIYTKAVTFHTESETVDAAAMVGLLTNRAACHLSTVRYEECAQDCSRALALAQQLRAEGRADIKTGSAEKLALIRRGTALCWVGKIAEGRRDYGEAIELQEREVAGCVDAEARGTLEVELEQLREDLAGIGRLQSGYLD